MVKKKTFSVEAPNLKAVPAKPSINLPRWSSANPSTTTAEPLDVQKDTGWTPIEKPGYKAMNWIFYSMYKWIDYLNTIVDWMKPKLSAYDSEVTYPADAVITSGGAQYKSLVSSNLGNAVTDATKWVCIYSPKTLGITANHTIDNTDGTIIATGASALTVTLPTAAANYAGRGVTVKSLITDDQLLTVAAASGNIDGKASINLSRYEAGAFKCDGTKWVLVGKSLESGGGGGLVPQPITIANFSGSPKKFAAESGKLYLIDMAGAAEQYTITAPAGATGVNFAVQVKNNENTTYLLAIEGFGGTGNLWYNDENQTSIKFAYVEMRVDFAWFSTGSHYLCAVSQTPVSGTFSGDLVLTGSLTTGAGKGIVGDTSGVAKAAGYVGEVFSLGSVSTGNLTNDMEVTVNFPTQLPAGNWQIFRRINVTAQTPTGVFRLRSTLSGETTLYSVNMSTAGVASGNGINAGAVGAYKNSASITVTATVLGWFASGTWNPSIDGYAIRIS